MKIIIRNFFWKMKTSRIIFLILVFHIIVAHTLAKAENVTSNHIIIAFDEAGTGWRTNDYKVRESIGYFLYDNGGDPLLKDSDYLSVVGFKADCSGEKWDEFVYVKKMNNGYLTFVKSNDTFKNIFSPNAQYGQYYDLWQSLTRYQGAISESYSLNSIAKPYVLAALGKTESKPLVNKTYIILITDHRYNGNDFYNELRYFIDTARQNGKRLDIHNVLNVCYKIEEEFCIKYVDAIEWNNSSRNVELFEVKPNQDYLTLPAVLSFSPSISAKRIRGGKYSFDFDIEYANQHFEVKRLKASLYRSESESRWNDVDVNHRIIDSLRFDNGHSKYHGTFKFDRSFPSPTLILNAELILKDGLYDAVLLTPEQIEGLTQKVKITKEEDARFFFGIIRLPDFLWIPGLNQYSAAIVLDFIILGLVIAAFLIYLKLSETYKPKSEDINICVYE